MLPKAILFDLDDTLISPNLHRRIFWRNAIQQIWEKIDNNSNNLPEDIENLVKNIDDAALEFWSDPERHKIGRLDLSKARFKIFDNGIGADSRFDIRTRWAIADRCGELMSDNTTLFPDAVSTLEKLRSQKVKLALVTNGTSFAQRAKIERFNLERFFEHIQIEGEAGIGKPELGAYLKAMNALDVRANDTWMVGDNIEWEVVAPQKLGIFAVWRDPRGDGTLPAGVRAKPNMIITKLSELVD